MTATATDLTKEKVIALLNSRDDAVYRALVVLYDRQTSDEQASQSTRHNNKRGFTAFDAEFLSSLAEQVNARGSLSAKQLACARRRLAHYTGQLMQEADAKRERQIAAATFQPELLAA